MNILDRYAVSAFARRTALVIFCMAALFWGLRQLSLTIKIWIPDPPATQVAKADPLVPDEAKTVGKNFLLNWYFTGKGESLEQKQKRIAALSSPKVLKFIQETPSLVPISEEITPNQVDLMGVTWIQKDQSAYAKYWVQMEDGQEMMIQIPLVKAESWMADGLPTLLPKPVKGNPKSPEGTALNEADSQALQQAVDGFFDSWLRGRLDQNTKTLNIPPTNLLEGLGTYKGVSVFVIQNEPLVIRAIVLVDSKGKELAFEYQLEVAKENNNYIVKKILGG